MTLDAMFRPAMPGCAVATEGRPLGTLGCIVRDMAPYDAWYILSAAHVIANHTFDPLGLSVFQPGKSPSAEQAIGVVARWGELKFTSNTYPNLFDAAIARVRQNLVRAEIHAIGRPLGINTSVQKGTLVQKCGATTGRTEGIVADPNFHCDFYYTALSGSSFRAGFQQQILCRSRPGTSSSFSDGGDSGAAVLDDAGRLIGLIVGRVSGGTVVCPIGPIFYSLRVVLA